VLCQKLMLSCENCVFTQHAQTTFPTATRVVNHPPSSIEDAILYRSA
jgi:hypothetical protein